VNDSTLNVAPVYRFGKYNTPEPPDEELESTVVSKRTTPPFPISLMVLPAAALDESARVKLLLNGAFKSSWVVNVIILTGG
jgi:hypothetical protein